MKEDRLRAEAEKYRADKLARAALAPISDAIAPLQVKRAHLTGLLNRPRLDPQQRRLALAEIDGLIEILIAHRKVFSETVGLLPIEMATNDRVIDIRKSLDNLSDAFTVLRGS